jgi:hypothetical protein
VVSLRERGDSICFCVLSCAVHLGSMTPVTESKIISSACLQVWQEADSSVCY